MKTHSRAKWLNYAGCRLWCCDFSDFHGDRQALAEEIRLSEAVIEQQKTNTLLLSVYMAKPDLSPELRAFLEKLAQPGGPVYKMAILGVTGWEKFWSQQFKNVRWPSQARFFMDYEKAKAWLVTETF